MKYALVIPADDNHPHLAADLADAATPLILLEYSDNRNWVETRMAAQLQQRFPSAEIRLQPISLTTGVHTGPGTWAVAVHPDPEGRRMTPHVGLLAESADHSSMDSERNAGRRL